MGGRECAQKLNRNTVEMMSAAVFEPYSQIVRYFCTNSTPPFTTGNKHAANDTSDFADVAVISYALHAGSADRPMN